MLSKKLSNIFLWVLIMEKGNESIFYVSINDFVIFVIFFYMI